MALDLQSRPAAEILGVVDSVETGWAGTVAVGAREKKTYGFDEVLSEWRSAAGYGLVGSYDQTAAQSLAAVWAAPRLSWACRLAHH